MEREYVRSLHCNYERLLLEEKPEENRFQYCMLSRGGIKGLLACSLRYLDGNAYLYYDITSRQNVSLLFQKTTIGRGWLLDFCRSMKHLQRELERFLLQDSNIMWEPDQIFQDLERNEFAFIYVPYYDGPNQFLKFLSFLVEHIDYEDELLVECVYRMYEQMENCGPTYLQGKIFEDVKRLEESDAVKEVQTTPKEPSVNMISEGDRSEEIREEEEVVLGKEIPEVIYREPVIEREDSQKKKGFLSFFDGKKNKNREMREQYRETLQQKLEGYHVAEMTNYEEDNNHTTFLDTPKEKRRALHKLYSAEGKLMACLENGDFFVGKAKERVDLLLDDVSVSRLHAKFSRLKDEITLEDLNSTNGTFVNGERLMPYEKCRLEPGAQIQCGKILLQYQ